MSIWVRIALFFTKIFFKIKKALGLTAPPPQIEDSGSAFSFNTIKRAESLNGFASYEKKAEGLNEIVKLECGGQSVFVKMADGKVEVSESGLEPTMTVSFSDAGWAGITSGADAQQLIMSGEMKFAGDMSGIMSHMGALKLLFIAITGNLKTD